MSDDERYLQILSIFHYVLAGFVAMVGCFPFIHLAVGIAMLSGAFPGGPHGGEPPAFFGWLIIAVATFVIAFFWLLAVCILVVGRKLANRTGHLFCLVAAGIECIFMPVGTVLGVFTILVLLRPGVKDLFNGDTTMPPTMGYPRAGNGSAVY